MKLCKKEITIKNETMPKKQPKEPEWTVETAPCPFPEDLEFVDMWKILLGQKKWLKKGLTAIQWNVKRLLPFEVEYAKELVSQAIERGWEGVVFAETKINYEIWKQKKTRVINGLQNSETRQQLRQDVSREFASRDYNNR